MAHDFDTMLQTIKDRQWSLADVDWEAPGAETMSAELRERMRPFMADLVWIEHIGARGFASLTTKAPTPVLAEIYRYFHAEEQKHANAELALMRRWGMLGDDEAMPEPNINIRMAIAMLDRYGDDLPLSSMVTVIPLLECALDGALVKFLLDEVEDPVCHEVFGHINSDESRHLAVDFQVMEQLGGGPLRKLLIETLGTLKPQVILALLVVFVPLLNRTRDNLVLMGLSEQRLYSAMLRYVKVGSRSPATLRIPVYRLLRRQALAMTDRAHPYHRYLADPMVRVTALVPARVLGRPQSWAGQLTADPIAS